MDRYVEARRSEPFSSNHPLWGEFSQIKDELEASEVVQNRPYLKIKWSMGMGNWAYLPWIALSDERETTTIKEGVYSVILFRQDLSGVYLTLNQGVTHVIDVQGKKQGHQHLLGQAADLRDYCENLESEGFQLDNEIDLLSDRPLPISYQHSTVVYRLYEKHQLPSDPEILDDLKHVLKSYLTSLPRKLRVARHAETLDNPPNRFVKFALERWREVVAQIRDVLEQKNRLSVPVKCGAS